MNTFTISQLQDYSGIKAHTIRIWEQRYNALQPNRTEGNTRYYDGNQLLRLLNIVSLMDSNHKVSQLCKMSDNELKELLEEQYENMETNSSDSGLFSSQLISAAFDFDEVKFEKLFSNCLLRYGLKETYVQVIYPALNRLGLLWSQSSLPPAHEHFIVNLIRKKILSAIASLPPAKTGAESWVLFLPEDEFHEVGLLMAYFIIRSAGKKVFYFGANVPTQSLLKSIEQINPNNALVFLVSKRSQNKSLDALNKLANEAKNIRLFVASDWNNSNQESINTESLIKIGSVEELEASLS